MRVKRIILICVGILLILVGVPLLILPGPGIQKLLPDPDNETIRAQDGIRFRFLDRII